MITLYTQHQIRTVQSLDSLWQYYFPTEGMTVSPQADLSQLNERKLQVPGVWESLPEYANYRGQALAVKKITLKKDAPLRVVFAGVSHTAQVYIDGELLGRHHNAYTGFAFDIPRAKAGEHELRVHISNEHGEGSALHVPNDYYNYGGISRQAHLHLLAQPIYIENLHLTPGVDENPRKVSAKAFVKNLNRDSVTATLSISVCGQTKEAQLTAPGNGTSETELIFELPDADLWEPNNPALYEFHARLLMNGEEVVDDLIERTGLRTVAVKGEQVMLNGKPIKIAGFNRHEDHPDFGCAIPVAMMVKDIELMLAMGANSVRTSHYPNDRRFLDLCDEYGLLVWEENHARGLRDEKFKHPLLQEQCMQCNEEMVTQHYNHPSIILWAIMNECMSDSEEGRILYKEQLDQLRSLDQSRPLTYATFRLREDLCQDLPDICSWNLYPNWYIHQPPAEALDVIQEYNEPKGMKGKPLILSEFGAGALYGYHDPIRRGKWSEERQCDLLKELFEDFTASSRVMGLYVWQFCDVRVDESWAMSRPRTMNNKGIVDEYRRPKLAFSLVKKYFDAFLSSP